MSRCLLVLFTNFLLHFTSLHFTSLHLAERSGRGYEIFLASSKRVGPTSTRDTNTNANKAQTDGESRKMASNGVDLPRAVSKPKPCNTSPRNVVEGTLPLLERKRILVTGGAGFIGSHLIDRLMEYGHDIICVDNFFTGSKHNVAHHMSRPNFELIRHDIVNPILLEVDQIYHLACPASPKHYKYNAVKTIKTNVIGTMNMLGLANRVKARILLSSTSEVYGDPLEHPQTEEYWGNVNPIGKCLL